MEPALSEVEGSGGARRFCLRAGSARRVPQSRNPSAASAPLPLLLLWSKHKWQSFDSRLLAFRVAYQRKAAGKPLASLRVRELPPRAECARLHFRFGSPFACKVGELLVLRPWLGRTRRGLPKNCCHECKSEQNTGCDGYVLLHAHVVLLGRIFDQGTTLNLAKSLLLSVSALS